MDLRAQKAAWRSRLEEYVSSLPEDDQGKRWRLAAEVLRRLPEYRQAPRLFIGPGPVLIQTRMNCLADGKDLVMPSAGLKEGFYLLSAPDIPFHKRAFAVTLKGLSHYGRRISQGDLAGLGIDLVVTDALAVDSAGGRLGKGDGMFDLAWAILAACGAFSPERGEVFVLPEIEECFDEMFPRDAWDVAVNAVVTADGVRYCEGGKASGGIVWPALADRQIRRITPLYHLWRQGQGEASAGGKGE